MLAKEKYRHCVVVWSNWGFLRLFGLTIDGPPTPTGPLSASSTRPNTATSNWVLQHFILCSHHKNPSTWAMTWRPLASNKGFQTGFPCEAETDPHWGAVFSQCFHIHTSKVLPQTACRSRLNWSKNLCCSHTPPFLLKHSNSRETDEALTDLLEALLQAASSSISL